MRGNSGNGGQSAGGRTCQGPEIMTTPIKQAPLRGFYEAMAVMLFAVSYGIFYVGAHFVDWRRVVLFVLGSVPGHFVTLTIRRAIWGEE
jgi:hypothetical protein